MSSSIKITRRRLQPADLFRTSRSYQMISIQMFALVDSIKRGWAVNRALWDNCGTYIAVMGRMASQKRIENNPMIDKVLESMRIMVGTEVLTANGEVLHVRAEQEKATELGWLFDDLLKWSGKQQVREVIEAEKWVHANA